MQSQRLDSFHTAARRISPERPSPSRLLTCYVFRPTQPPTLSRSCGTGNE